MCFILDAKFFFFDGCTAEKLMHFCPPVYHTPYAFAIREVPKSSKYNPNPASPGISLISTSEWSSGRNRRATAALAWAS